MGLDLLCRCDRNFADAIIDGADFYKAELPATMPKIPPSVLLNRPSDWDKLEDQQKSLAVSVAASVCGPSLSGEQEAMLKDNRSEIVTGLITNALYPKKEEPGCEQTQAPQVVANAPICPTEQPETYRKVLADELSKCPVKVLSADEADYLRTGKFKEHFAKRP